MAADSAPDISYLQERIERLEIQNRELAQQLEAVQDMASANADMSAANDERIRIIDKETRAIRNALEMRGIYF